MQIFNRWARLSNRSNGSAGKFQGAQIKARTKTGTTTAIGLTLMLGAVLSLSTPVDSSQAATVAIPAAKAQAAKVPAGGGQAINPASGFTLPAELAKEFPEAQSYCMMGPEKITVSKTAWKAYACSDYRSLILVGSWANGDTYVFTLTPANGKVIVRGSGVGPVDAIALTLKSLRSLSIGGLVDMSADVVASWNFHKPASSASPK